jgi:DNA polymerase
MGDRNERGLLLASLKGYLEELRDTGLDELVFGGPSAAGGVDGRTPAEFPIRGSGNPRARLLFVLTGVGFAAPSGELLSKVILAMGFSPEHVYLLGFDPVEPGDADRLRQGLLGRIAAVAPEVVVALGEPAAQLLMASGDPIALLRGRFLDLAGIPLLATLHPDQLLLDAALKRQVWNEMQQVMARLKNGAR